MQSSVFVLALLAGGALSIPTLDDMAGKWINPNVPVSKAAPQQNEASQRDLPVITNFWGSVGISPQKTRPVDMFAVNALEMAPFTGCGAKTGTNPYGCGRMHVDGQHVMADTVRWSAYEAGRRAAQLPSGLLVETATRMPYEQYGVMWQVNLTNNGQSAITPNVTFELTAMAQQYATIGKWKFLTPYDPAQFKYSLAPAGPNQQAVLSQNTDPTDGKTTALFLFAGDEQPDSVELSTPSASFTSQEIQPGQTVTIRVALAVGKDVTASSSVAAAMAADAATFDRTWQEAKAKWETRWGAVFTPGNTDFSGHLPTLSMTSATPAAVTTNVERVYYMTILSVLAIMQTNLPIVYNKVFMTSQGNVAGHMGFGGSRGWWWDQSLTSTMIALLVPTERERELQAWFSQDLLGRKSNGLAYDCDPPGSSCGGVLSDTATTAKETEVEGTEAVESTADPFAKFYCYNTWAVFLTVSNHLRVNNDTTFLHSIAGAYPGFPWPTSSNPTNLTVDQVLEKMAYDWRDGDDGNGRQWLINGTKLVDYGDKMDGFSPSYKHVMPGCSQGNNVWMMRQVARLRELQGNEKMAQDLRQLSAEMAAQTIDVMYEKGKGYFNVISPVSAPNPSQSQVKVQVNEMRHVVDMFSVTFGMCGGTKNARCDFDDHDGMREEVANWYLAESVTSTWIRATSPRCNCSNTREVLVDTVTGKVKVGPSEQTTTAVSASASASAAGNGDNASYPAFVTCAAGRPDHGSNGAYPSWPAFATEALCYLQHNNCTAALGVMARFAATTAEGPFGQARQVPQLSTPPYTPFDELAFKPVAVYNRYVGIEGGAFFDSILRGFFGYHPDMQWPDLGPEPSATAVNSALTGMLFDPTTDRGFQGSLSNLRTPLGDVTVSSTAQGLSIKLQ